MYGLSLNLHRVTIADHIGHLYRASFKDIVQFLGHAHGLQKTEKRLLRENDKMLSCIFLHGWRMPECNSVRIDLESFLGLIRCRRLIDDFILVAALISYQIKRILENFFAFLFGFFLPFLCGLKAGSRGFSGLTLLMNVLVPMPYVLVM